MSPLVVIGVSVGAVAVAIVLLWGSRRFLHVERPMSDVTRSDYYGVVATAFAVLLAFVVFNAAQSYNRGNSGAEAEAVALTEMFRTSQFFGGEDAERLEGDVTCLTRASVAEWPLMDDGGRNPDIEYWLAQKRATMEALDASTPIGETALGHLFDEEQNRTAGRRERLSEAEGAVVGPIWYTLIVGGLAVILLPILFMRPTESVGMQSILVGAVTLMVVTGLALVWFLDHPYGDAAGSIKPSELERSLETMQTESPGLVPPCGEDGNPV